MGGTQTWQTEHSSWLGSGRYLESLCASFEQRDLHIGAKGGFGHAQSKGVDQVIALSSKRVVGANSDLDLEIAGQPATTGEFAPAAKAKPGARTYPCRDFHPDFPLSGYRSQTPTMRARVGHGCTHTGAGGAGGHGHHCPEQTSPGHSYRSAATTRRAGDNARAGSGAVAATDVTNDPGAKSHVAFSPKGGSRQVYFDRNQDIAASRDPTLAATGEETAVAKHRPEQIVEPSEVAKEIGEINGVTTVVPLTAIRIG
jgi:hypothetical protein